MVGHIENKDFPVLAIFLTFDRFHQYHVFNPCKFGLLGKEGSGKIAFTNFKGTTSRPFCCFHGCSESKKPRLLSTVKPPDVVFAKKPIQKRMLGTSRFGQ